MSLPPTPLRLGMIGGGQGAFIGAVHRHAARLDNAFTLTAGALSAEPQRALASAREVGLPPDRSYPTWQDMLTAERARTGDRLDAVSIVTPNHTHFEIALAFVEAGFNVILDKPMVHTSAQADQLVRAVQKHGVVFAITYNYTGYPMVRHAAHLVRAGTLGTIRKVFVEYHQGWLATRLEAGGGEGQKQAAWRNDPAKAGPAGAIGDIGSHAENLLSAVTGLRITSLCADLTTFVPGRPLDDDATVMMRLDGGAKAVLTASQVCIGEENNLTLRIHGDKGSLWWRQEEPNHLTLALLDGSTTTLGRGSVPGSAAANATRLPPGHPEGFIEAFANIYKGVAQAITSRTTGRETEGLGLEFPTVHDGARGVRFIERALASSKAGGVWVDF